MSQQQTDIEGREPAWTSWFVPPVVIPLAACLLVLASAIIRFGM